MGGVTVKGLIPSICVVCECKRRLCFVNCVRTEIPDCVARPAGAEERHGSGAAALLVWEQSSGPALAASAGDRRDSAHRSEDEARGAAAGGSRSQDDGALALRQAPLFI